MKICTKCKTSKELIEYNNKKTSRDGLSGQCRGCQKKYTRVHYKKNKKYYKNKARKYDSKIKEWFNDYRSKLKCEVCGEDHPSTFDFHHIYPSKKIENISVLVVNGSLKKLQSELLKCKVFCANCHRKFHWNERNNTLV
jgi:hypothetical protein